MATAPLYYLGGFSTAGTAQSMSCTIASAAATVASGTYAYTTFESIMGTGSYADFGVAVKAAFDTAGGGPWTLLWAPPDVIGTGKGTWTVSRGSNFTLEFTASNAAHMRLRAALGLVGTNVAGVWTLSGATSYTSTVAPLYSITPQMSGRTDFTNVYEPDDIVEEAVSDGGTSYAVSKNTSELWCDWSQAMETKAATFVRSASATYPWTWQAMVKHLRGQHPFGVYETAVGNTLHKLRAESGSFRPDRYVTDYDGLWSIPFMTRDLGALP